jgi:hypothetical protein
MNKFFIIFAFCTVSLSTLFSQDQTNDVKRTIIIMPSYYMNYDKEFDFLGILIRDSIKAKLDTKNAFNISDVDLVYKAIDRLQLSSQDYIIKDKVKDASYLTGSDVALVTKFSVSNKKIMIVCEAFDILNPQSSVTSTVNGTVGPDIFDSVDKISNDIADKMTNVFQSIDPQKLASLRLKSAEFAKEIEQQNIEIQKTEIENQKIENIITRSSSLEEVFKLKYSGISLGTKYELAEMIVKGSNFDRKIIKDKNTVSIVIKGSMNSIFASKETILNFKEDILTDIWILAGETTEAKYDSDLKTQASVLRRDFGKETSDSKYFTWQDEKINIELADVKTKNNRMFLFIHGYLNSRNISIDRVINYPELQVFDDAMSLSVGFGTSLGVFTKWINYFAFKKENASAPLTADNYTTSFNKDNAPAFIMMRLNIGVPISLDFYKKKFSTGFMIEPSYSFNLAASTSNNSDSDSSSAKSSNQIFVHSANLNISGRSKFNFKTIGNSLVFEYGLLTEFDYFQNMDESQYKTIKTWSENSTNYFYVLYISNMYFSAGPIVNLMFEFQNKNHSNQVGFYLAAIFGFGTLKLSEKYLFNFNSNIQLGICYRFSYYNLKIRK